MTQMNFIYETETESQTENRLVAAKGKSDGGGKDREAGISRHKLVYTEWTDDKVLL